MRNSLKMVCKLLDWGNEVDSNLEMDSLVADNSIQGITSPTAPDYDLTFLSLDNDTDSDREFKSGRLGHDHP